MKKYICLAVVLLLVLCTAGCGKKSENTAAGTKTAVTESTEKKSAATEKSGSKTKKSAATEKKSKKNTSSQSEGGTAAAQGSKKIYPDADTDFTGRVTIVGRWHCVQKIYNGTVTDQSSLGAYYIFSSDMSLESSYNGSTIVDYDTYELGSVEKGSGYETGTVTMHYGTGQVTIGYRVEVGKLMLYTLDGTTKTIYERAKYN